MLPNGAAGFRLGLKHHPDHATAQRNSVTQMDFYARRIMIRNKEIGLQYHADHGSTNTDDVTTNSEMMIEPSLIPKNQWL